MLEQEWYDSYGILVCISIVLAFAKRDDDPVSRALTQELMGRRGMLGGLRGHRVPPAFEVLDTRKPKPKPKPKLKPKPKPKPKPHRAEPKQAEPSLAEPTRAGPCRAEPSRA